jgi:ABC-type uncharacterized transport system involved in gliding motility auxiliary subunit
MQSPDQVAKAKQFQTLLFSSVGVGILFLAVIAFNVIASAVRTRLDLTSERLYTLSPGTKAILAKLDTPVELRFYYSKNDNAMPVHFKNYAQRVEDLLAEYRQVSRGKIEIRKLNPLPDSEAEDSANLDGIEGQTVNLGLGDKIYLGLSVQMLDSKAAIPSLSPEREKLLEYDVSRAIASVIAPTRPVVGVISALPLFGDLNPMMMRMGRAGRSEPWVLITELKRDFEVKQLQMDVDKIDDDIKVLVVVYPKGISEKTQYAIDQFLLRGGKLLALLDPLSIVDNQSNPMAQQNPLQAAGQGGASMDTLLAAWGLKFDISKVAADMNFMTRINRGGRADSAPAVLSLTTDAVNTNDVVTSQVDNLLLPFTGVFTGTAAEGLKQTVLLKTSTQSQVIEKFMAEFSGEQAVKDFKPSGTEHNLAVRLTGKFKTAFPNGKPGETPKPTNADKDTPAQTPSAGDGLKEAAAEGVVILVGDADFAYDQFSVQVQEFFGQRIVIPRNGNLNFVQSMVEQLGGDSNLIAVRSRASMNRPFTVVRRMQAEAEGRYRDKLRDLEKSLQEAQTRLNELQKSKQEGGQRFILSPEQQAEIRNFRKKEADVKRELKLVRRDLNREIDALETRLKWINIAGMPLLVTASGISLALIKRKKTAAR